VHCGLIILDGINYPVISLANAISFMRREFFGALGPRITSQGLDTLDNMFEAFFGNTLKFFYGLICLNKSVAFIVPMIDTLGHHKGGF